MSSANALVLGVSLALASAGAVSIDRGGPDLGFVGGANQPTQLAASSDCAGGTCVVHTRQLTPVGAPLTISPNDPSSKLLLECSFQAHVELVREANTAGYFQLQELGPNGAVNVGGTSSLYAVLSSYGAAAGAPVTMRVLLPRAGNQPRLFRLAAFGNGVTIPRITISDKVCTVTEISN